ncbi:High-copy suppressor of rspA [Providencia rettgeri]|uniref:High-copy suppressor of rspA n=1 Tax=Providencia rettgeri TaxID=587 RepID=A0A379FKF7_PRORE|nr:High-copy suppressor of rspA [Providencia rettgeri]
MFKTAKNMSGLPWIAAMAFFMQALDATILNTALPDIARSLDHSPLAMQSAVVSYTLTVALLIPVSGWFADRFGTRRIFIFSGFLIFSWFITLCPFAILKFLSNL